MVKKKEVGVRPIGIIHANKDFKAHIHKVIIEECGGHEIPYILSANIALLYNPNLSLDDLLASVDVLKQVLKLRVQREVEAKNE